MRISDNIVVWAKVGNAKFLTQVSKDILVYGSGCVAVFVNLNTWQESIFVANSPSGNGDGISELKGHKSVYIFAYAENCKYPRMFVKKYPGFENVFVFDDRAPEGYVGIAFSETSRLITLGNYPKFTLTVWDWRSQVKLEQIHTNVDYEEQIIKCNWSKPVNMVHLCKNSKKVIYWDLFMCCKEFIIGQHEVKIPPLDNIGPLTQAVWTTEGGLYLCDAHGSLYMVDTEFTLERVFEAHYEGTCPPNIVWYKAGFLISGPDKVLRHYIKKLGIWTCDWKIDIETDLHKFSNINGKLFGVDDTGEILKITEEGELVHLNDTSNQFDDFCLISPTGEYIVAPKKHHILFVFKVENGEFVSKLTLENYTTTISANPTFPYIGLGCENGILDLVSVYKPEKLSIMTSLHLCKNPINQIKFFEMGRIIVTAFLEKGEILIIEGFPGSQMKVVAYVEVRRQVVDFILVSSKTSYYLYILPVSSKYGAGNQLICYCITDNEIISMKQYFIEPKEQLYYRLIPSLKPNNDRTFYGLPFDSRNIHELETRKGDSIARVVTNIKSGHLFRHFYLKLTEDFAYTWGYDGFIFVRDINFIQEITAIRVHHRYDLGVKKVYINPLGLYVISLGYDNVLCCTKVNNINIKQNLTKSDKLMFHQPIFGFKLEAIYDKKTWIEINAMEKLKKEQKLCKVERNQILLQFEEIKKTLNDLVTKNLEGPILEKIDLLEFYLDMLNFNRKKKDNREKCIQTQKYLKALIDAQNVVSKHIIKTYYEPMGVQGQIIRGIFQKTVATKYTLLPSNDANLKNIAQVEEQRKLEEFFSFNCTFQPWLISSKEELIAQLKFRPIDLDYNMLTPRTMLEEGFSQLSIDSQIAMDGSVLQQFIQRNPWHYKPRQLVSFYQCDLQETITDNEVIRLKQHYNKTFNNIAELKLREMENIKKNQDRLRYIIQEYNYFSDSKIDFDVEDPQWTQDEDINMILTVFDNELNVVPYVSSSEQALTDATSAEEERIRTALLADDFKEQTLYQMMSGVLEVKWEDELKKNVPLPKCMIEKRSQNYNDEDKRLIDEYEKKVSFLNMEREKYKNMLKIDFNKISVLLRDSIREFNQKLKDTVEIKMSVDSGINQEYLIVNRARLSQNERVKLYKIKEGIKANIEKNVVIIQDLIDTINHLNEILNETKINLEAMQYKEKILEKAFKKDMQDYSPPIQEQALKIYRKRPKWNFRQINASSMLTELAKCVITQESSLIISQECLDYLKSLDHLDEYVGVPPSIDELNFRAICKYRRIRIEYEIKLRASQMQLIDGEAVVANGQKRLATKKERNIKLATELNKCMEIYLFLMHNIQIQIVLRKGLVEIPLTGDIMHDFHDAVLTPKKEIEHINELIKKAGFNKLKTIQQNMAFRRRIMVTEWDHKKLRMTINDLIEQINDINAVKLLRDMQVCLKERVVDRKEDINSLEYEFEVISGAFETDTKNKREKLAKIHKQMVSYQEHNKVLDKTIQELNIDVRALKSNHDSELDYKESNAVKTRMNDLKKRNELLHTIQGNQDQILVLQTELELLRLRTYPTFKYKLINLDEK